MASLRAAPPGRFQGGGGAWRGPGLCHVPGALGCGLRVWEEAQKARKWAICPGWGLMPVHPSPVRPEQDVGQGSHKLPMASGAALGLSAEVIPAAESTWGWDPPELNWTPLRCPPRHTEPLRPAPTSVPPEGQTVERKERGGTAFLWSWSRDPGSVYPPTYLSLSSCLFAGLSIHHLHISVFSIYCLFTYPCNWVSIYPGIISVSSHPSICHPEVHRTFQTLFLF